MQNGCINSYAAILNVGIWRLMSSNGKHALSVDHPTSSWTNGQEANKLVLLLFIFITKGVDSKI